MLFKGESSPEESEKIKKENWKLIEFHVFEEDSFLPGGEFELFELTPELL